MRAYNVYPAMTVLVYKMFCDCYCSFILICYEEIFLYFWQKCIVLTGERMIFTVLTITIRGSDPMNYA
jgi:hypothetical protein